ncbi:Lipid II flippase FtsW [Candidatus Bealeia paramacronuclearis]|uniref:Probable peptidoglycan glycosyltransferase FtsW n=1 Tax=Candidatus Bealeia paramacronuclearis TaxID=1921001 RepID=A0ABZ2C3B3_9PROT|nr:Lipid II flippase FtsW [Candidatus Bealeia paramacronuclearis]
MLRFERTDTSPLGRWWWTVDRWTLAAVLLLMGLGILLVLAASPAVAHQHNWSSFYFAKKHLIFLAPTVFVLVATSLLSLKQIKTAGVIVFGGAVLLLIATPFVGIEIKGAQRWIDLGGFSIQPSEFVKPAFAIVSAWMFSQKDDDPTFPGNLVSIGLYLLVVGLLLIQPDLGMTVLITAMWLCQFFLAGLPVFWIILGGASGVGGLVGAYFMFPHVSRRIDRFLEPSDGADKYGDRYQINQSLEAFSNGGFLGQGPGEGIVKRHLPDAHADFIFAVAAEEFGMILCLILVVIFGLIVIRSFSRIFTEHNLFVVLAVTGLIVQFGLQAIINMASTLSLMPTKGMTLPFISYGGSSMLALAFGMGMILALTRRRISE